MQQARTHLESLLADGKLDETIDVYTQLSRQYHDPERTEKGILENSRYNDLMAQHLHGTISQADYQLERARINRSALHLIKEIPANWKYPYEPPPAPEMPVTRPVNDSRSPVTAPQKSFLEKWGLILGIVASVTTVLGITVKSCFFPDPTPPNPGMTLPAQQTGGNSGTDTPVPSDAPPSTTANNPAKTTTPPSTTAQKPNPSTRNPTQSGTTTTLATPDRKFRSYAKPQVAEDMEKGFILEGNKVAYRNLKTKAILCCFEDGEMFENGKARVSENGKDYYFIDKNGKKTQ